MENLDQEFVRMRQARRRTVSDASAASTSFGGAVAFQVRFGTQYYHHFFSDVFRLIILFSCLFFHDDIILGSYLYLYLLSLALFHYIYLNMT